MLRARSRAIVFAGILLAAVHANWNDTSTGIDLRKLRQFPLTKVRSGQLKPGMRTRFDGIDATAANSDERISPARSSRRVVAAGAAFDAMKSSTPRRTVSRSPFWVR